MGKIKNLKSIALIKKIVKRTAITFMHISMRSFIVAGLIVFMLLPANGKKFEMSCFSNEVHALILARGGSKGIKYKNLITIDGKSILARTIDKIQCSGLFSHVWVSTDNEKIANEALECGALVHRRSNFYAQDKTSSLDSVKEFLNSHATVNKFALFQCTSPFLKVQYIKEAYWKFQRSDCVFSVTRSYKLRWKDIHGAVIPINFDPSLRPRRQSWNGELVENGMFYFSSRKLIERNVFQNEKCAIVEIDPAHSVDVDTFNDVILARCLNFVEESMPPLSG